ncbi:hypothetical protein MNB_ARC-1_927 [hydrothermal vent metagenome]|uniref:Uncharacterized protein n=1 Tax=hydrothermal vent metagenome TaxID=652676 RepID=A0A3B1E5C2_9ZZZZ
MRMSIEYNNDTSKLQIQEAISKVEKNMGLYPSVIRRAISADAGNFSVEFESAGITREAGDFCENVMKELGIKHCEV